MNFKDYIIKTREFVTYPPERESAYLRLGLLGEHGELASAHAKFVRGDYGIETLEQKKKDESADLLWFTARIADLYGVYEPDYITSAASDAIDTTTFELARAVKESNRRLIPYLVARQIESISYSSGGVPIMQLAEANIAKLEQRKRDNTIKSNELDRLRKAVIDLLKCSYENDDAPADVIEHDYVQHMRTLASLVGYEIPEGSK